MKEVTIRLVDNIAECIAQDAKEKGVSSEELVKYILGTYAQGLDREREQSMPHLIGVLMSKALSGIPNRESGIMSMINKELLKQQARAGALSCKQCTMKLTEQDVDNDKCGACGVPLKVALGEE